MKKCTVIDNASGEILNEHFNIDELEDIQRKKDIINKKKSDDEFKIFIDENLGNFYFLFYKLIRKGIERQYIVRFLYLCTYMNYENKLLFGNSSCKSKYMREKDFEEILRLSKREAMRTKQCLLENNFLIINKNKVIQINKKYCIKGKIESAKKKSPKVRIFENGLKELYEKSKPREHKKLSLLIELLLYINLKFNIICENPQCEKIEDIKPMNLTKITKLLNFSTVQKLKKGLSNISIQDEKVIGIFTIGNKSMILINPRIYYKGTKVDDVQYLLNLFKLYKNM